MENNDLHNIYKNELWNAINQQMININSIESKQKCYIIMAIDIYKKCSIQSDIQYLIRQTISINKIQNLTHFLKYTKEWKS
jgi:hypothetical protein